MRPVNFKGSNIVMEKPSNMTDEQCMPLNAFKGFDDNVGNYFVTAWTPNKEDMEALQRGEPLYVMVCGSGLPPMSLYTMNEDNTASND